MRRTPLVCALRLASALLLTASVSAAAQRDGGQPDSLYTREHYTKAEYMVPMRDGVKLYTIVYTPKDTSQAVPIMLLRTPYGIPPYPLDEYKRVLGPSPEFDRDGFIFVYQDARGKFRSEGTFRVMNPYKPVKHSKQDVDESSDNYDTIDWLLKNIPHNNGRVGQWGISYPAWQTVMGMIAAHPALKAASPQSSPSNMFIGDDFHHNGAFRFMYAFNWLSGNARPRGAQTTDRGRPFDYGTTDAYHFFLDIATVPRVNDLYFHDQLPTWNDFLEHPNYDRYWQDQDVLKDLKGITPAVLNVTGWFDQEDFYGPMSIYYAIEKNNPGNKSTLVVGPWNHGGWGAGGGDSLGPVKFGSPTGEYFRREVQLPFFEHYLKDRPGTPPEAVVFETGTNVWKTYDSWPPRQAMKKSLYLQPGGKLSFSPPASDAVAYDSYVDDPAHPVPFTTEKRPTQGFLWMVEDQWFASTRPDVLVYQTEPLDRDLTIAGPIIAKMRVSTSGTDADFVVKLVDVFPDNLPPAATVTADASVQQQGGRFAPRGDQRMRNYQMLVGAEVFRAKYRKSYTKPEPMVPNQVTPIEWDLRDKYHTFQKGHRIMVQVQSSWFPLIDRNPHKFMDIYAAKPSDFAPATQRIYHSAAQPSQLELMVMPQ
jgi:uncharacterized protein